MKRTIAIALLVGALVLGGVLVNKTFDFGKVSYVNQTVEVERVVEVDTLEKRIKDAQEAKATEIEAAAKSAYDSAKEQALTEIELEVRTAYRKELEAEESEVAKKTKAY